MLVAIRYRSTTEGVVVPGRSRLTYAQALKLLERDDKRISMLDRLLGGALLAAAPAAGGASLALLDPKNEVIGWLRDLTDTAPGRIKAARGKQHYELLEATHTVLALSAFFDALRDEIGPRYAELELTDADKLHAADLPAPAGRSLPEELRSATLPMPSATRGFVENQAQIGKGFERLFDHTITLLEGLSAWQRIRPRGPAGELRTRIVERALGYYRDRLTRLAADLPEFAFWISVDEHAATRSAVAGAVERVERAMRAQADALAELPRLLAQTVSATDQVRDVAGKLARQAADVLDQPLWRAEHPLPGLVFPAVRDGFVSPRFRFAVADGASRPADESWWAQQPERADLATFLAHYLADPESARRPLVILGHPGAGKTLLAEVIAARLPAEAYTAVLVRLRRVDADAEPHQQIETAVESAAREHASWGAICRESATTKVVIFDGFDELVQATGVTQSGYVERIARFQGAEWADGNSVVPIITSRTLVMDRARLPDGAVLVKLGDFTDEQVARWVDAWNRANLESPSFRQLSPAELIRQGELARQPLLLTLLAIYAADSGVDRLDAEDLSKAELYRRLLDSFIARQVRDKSPAELGETEQRRREAELRRDLAVAAFGMFNRGQQFVTEDELDRDLDALAPGDGRADRTGFGEPFGRARRTAAAFFFIHAAQSDQHDQAKARRTYEFLHATFGEYLIAEHAITLLRELARELEHKQARVFAGRPDDGVFRALLAHQPLLKRRPVVDFASDLAQPDEGNALRRTAIELLANARDSAAMAGVAGYDPTPSDAVRRLAAYTANLVTIAALTTPAGVPVADLAHGADWQSTVWLWRAGLDREGQESVFGNLKREQAGLVSIGDRTTFLDTVELGTVRLAADLSTEAYLLAGMNSWPIGHPATAFQRDFHTTLANLATWQSSTPSRRSLTFADELLYRELLEKATAAGEPIALSSGYLLFKQLVGDGPLLPRDLVSGLVRIATSNLDQAGFGIGPTQTLLLIARCPYLLDDHPDLSRVLEADLLADMLVLVLPALRSMPHLPERFRAAVARIESLAEGWEPEVGLPIMAALSADIVEKLATIRLSGRLAFAIVHDLRRYGSAAWRQIRPGVLAALVSACADLEPDDEAMITGAIADYLATHGRPGAPTGLAEAQELLARYQAEESSTDEH